MVDLEVQLDDIVERLGLPGMPEVLEWAATPLDRGHHFALLAAEGSGKEALFGLAVLVDCAADGEIQGLILVPDADRVARVSRRVQRTVEPSGFVVTTPGSARGMDADSTADILVARATTLLPLVRSGMIGLGALKLLIVDGYADLRSLGEWSSAEPILETAPEGCRKVLVSHRSDEDFLATIRRQLPRARTWPDELLSTAALPEGDGSVPATSRTIRCRLASVRGLADAVADCLADAASSACGGAELSFADAAACSETRAALLVAGFTLSDGGDPSNVRVKLGDGSSVAAIQVGLPLRLEQLRTALPEDARGYVVVDPSHAAQLDVLLARLGARRAPVPGEGSGGALHGLEEYRSVIRDAVDGADWMPDLAVIEPLLAELGAAPVAAALSRLYRIRHVGADGPIRPWPDVEAASTIPEAGSRPERRRRRPDDVPLGARSAWTRLYFGVGRSDEAKPSDLVGAITGEAGIAGGQIGKIEVMNKFSLVEVDSQVADLVLEKLDGVTIRGRDVPVRLDRDG